MDLGEKAEDPLSLNDHKNGATQMGEKHQADPKKDIEPDVKCDDETKQSLTKTQLKKLKKKERWEQVKTQKRKAEKERYKARKRACLERGEDVGPSRKQLRHNKMSKSNCQVRVVVDCDFDQYMADKDIKMLVKQIQFSYSANRRAENPLQFHCCGISGKTKDRLENLGDYKGWDIYFHSEGYLELFDKASVVYLSSESPNILNTLEEDKVYIIGGLVDHNHQKGLCHRLAMEKGIAHAQLPIADYIDMKTRKVLTINHVFEILLNYTETKDWQKSFYKVLPQRKGAVPKVDMPSEKEESADFRKGEDSCSPCSDKGDNSSNSNFDEGVDSSKGDFSNSCDSSRGNSRGREHAKSTDHEHSFSDTTDEQCTASNKVAAESVTSLNVTETTSSCENNEKIAERT